MTLRIKGATTIKGLTSVNWSPNLLFAAGEQGVWYDPSDFSTMFQDTAGTTPVTATGQSVARINDKSGRGNNATQSDAAKQPTLQIDGNGKYYLSFDGSNDCLVTSNVDFSATRQATIFASARKTGSAIQVVCELTASIDANNGAFVFGTTASNNWLPGIKGTLYPFFASVTYNAPITTIAAISFDMDAVTREGTIAPRYNTVLNQTGGGGATNAGTGNLSSAPINVGARNNGSSFALNGRIYGLIIRGAASTASQISMTETYMNSKTAAY